MQHSVRVQVTETVFRTSYVLFSLDQIGLHLSMTLGESSDVRIT